MRSANNMETSNASSYRRFTAAYPVDPDEARRVAGVPHIHDLTGQKRSGASGCRGVPKSGSANALPGITTSVGRAPRSFKSSEDRFRRLSAAPLKRWSTGPFPTWERSLRSGASLPAIAQVRSHSHKGTARIVPGAGPAVTKGFSIVRDPPCDAPAVEVADSDSFGPSLTDSEGSEHAPHASNPNSRRPSSDLVIRYDRVSLRGREEEAALRSSARVHAALDTLTTLFLPRWRLYCHLSRRKHAWAEARAAANDEFRRVAAARCQAVNLIANVMQHRLTTLVPYAVGRLREAAVRIQRGYRAHRRALDAVVELNYRQIRQHEERRYWARVVVEREDALQRQADARAATLAASAAPPRGDPSVWRGPHKRSPQPGMPLELDVYNYFLVGPLPKSLVRTELRKAVVAALHQRLEKSRLSSWMMLSVVHTVKAPLHPSDPHNAHGTSGVPSESTRLLPTFLPKHTLVAVLDNVCFLASQFRNDPMLRSHLRGRPDRIRAYN